MEHHMLLQNQCPTKDVQDKVLSVKLHIQPRNLRALAQQPPP
jgi:hypothetical protein